MCNSSICISCVKLTIENTNLCICTKFIHWIVPASAEVDAEPSIITEPDVGALHQHQQSLMQLGVRLPSNTMQQYYFQFRLLLWTLPKPNPPEFKTCKLPPVPLLNCSRTFQDILLPAPLTLSCIILPLIVPVPGTYF